MRALLLSRTAWDGALLGMRVFGRRLDGSVTTLTHHRTAQALKEMVLLPLVYPELFKAMQVDQDSPTRVGRIGSLLGHGRAEGEATRSGLECCELQ